MTDPLEFTATFGQKCLGNAPVLVIGSGLSIPHGLPSMALLQTELTSKLTKSNLSPEDKAGLAILKQHLETMDLEAALSKVSLSEELTKCIVDVTWAFINPLDEKVLTDVFSDRQLLPLSRLLGYLFQSTHTKISVVTTNYDRLVEYASSAAGLHYSNGFGFGYLAEKQNTTLDIYAHNRRVRIRTVEIWKVHGSLDWFSDPSGSVVCMPIRPSDLSLCRPVIVTPGVNKYQKSLQEPFRSIVTGADSTMMAASGYFCTGYGFNDSHIQPKLVERCFTSKVPLVVLARDLTTNAKQLLLTGKCQNFLALEKHVSGTMMYCCDNPDGTLIPDQDLWQLDKFLDITT